MKAQGPPHRVERRRFSESKKPRRGGLPQAAKKCNHFLSRHVCERKYFSGCKCGHCAPSAYKVCAQQTASLLAEMQAFWRKTFMGFRHTQKTSVPNGTEVFVCVRVDYLSSTEAPTSSSFFLSSSASSLETCSLMAQGTPSTFALASARPRLVISRTALMTLIF